MTDRLQDLLEGARTDLTEIAKGIRWAWGLAYGIPGKGLDAVRGVSLRTLELEDEQRRKKDPDFVPGKTYDLGMGDHAARAALIRTGRFLGDAEHVFARARIFAGWRDWPRFSYEYMQPGDVRDLDNLLFAVRLCARLVGDIEVSYPSANDLAKRKTLKEVAVGHQYLRNAVGGLDRALRRGEEAMPLVPECANAGCKNLASMRVLENGDLGKREAGLCDRCARFKRRNGELPSGHRLYRELDRSPWQAQNNRRANGLDHGEESLAHSWKGPR